MKTQVCFALSAGALLLLAGSETRAAGGARAVSAAKGASATASGNSLTPTFSADGRFVVFLSHANNLVTNDDLAPYLDVLVRDLTASNTVLVSVNIGGVGGGNGDSS